MKKLFVLLFFLIPAFNSFSYSLSGIDQARISLEQQRLESILSRNGWSRRACYTGALAALGGGVYYLKTMANAKPDPAEDFVKNLVNELAEKIKAAATTIKDLPEAVKDLPDMIQVLLKDKNFPIILKAWTDKSKQFLDESNRSFLGGAGHWFKDQAGYVITLAASSELMLAVNGSLGPIGTYLKRLEGFVGNQVEKVFFDVTLEWYLKHYGRLKPLFAQVEIQAALLEGKEVSYDTSLLESSPADSQQDFIDEFYHKNALVQTWKLLSDRLHGLIAYLQFKEAQALEQQELIGKRFTEIKNKVISLVDRAAGNLNAELEKQEGQTAMHEIFKKFRASLEIELQAFADFETFLMN